MSEDSGEKSQDPTPHRRQQMREEGQVARSQDLSSAGALVGGVTVLIFAGGSMAQFMAALLGRYLSGDTWSLWLDSSWSSSTELVTAQWRALLPAIGGAVLPVLVLMLLVNLGVNLLQTGFLFVPQLAMPDASRVNPLTGLGRLLSLTSLMRLAFGMFKIGVVATVAGISLYNRRVELLSLAALDLPQIALQVWQICIWTSLKIGIALLILAIFDYAYQRWKYERDLRMTPQEVREEMRNMQGDPAMTARRRSMQRQMAMNRLSKTVPKADVVITNPTELAVALQYDADAMGAPIVVAKGAGVIAARIRRLALESGIPIVEKKPLAQALYKEVDLNHPIPDKLYAAVAEVLAYVYQLKNKPIPKAG